MRRFLLSALFAAAMLSVTAGTALMATPTTGATCSADQGKVLVSFIYDASQTPPPITAVQVDSTDTRPVNVGVTFLDLTTGAIITNLSGSVNPGQTVYNVAPFNQHMVAITSPKWGTFWAFPYIVACSG